MTTTEPDRSHRTGRNHPIPDMLCAWGGCVFLTGHLGLHSWESFRLPIAEDEVG